MTTREAINTFKRRLHGVWPDHELQQMMRIILEDVMHYTPVDAVIHEHDELRATASSTASSGGC